MNLMKLLTVGQSLKKGPVLGKYKLQQILLPKFGSTVRPSKSKRMTEAQAPSAAPISIFTQPVAPVASALTTPICSVETKTLNESASRAMDKTQKIPAGKILRRIEEPVTTSREPGFMSKLMSRCMALLQKQISLLKKKIFPVRSKKKSGLAPVQTEWSLEKVTVIRNDLSEADLEIVAPKKALATVEIHKPNLPDLSHLKSSGMELIKKTTRLFKTSSPFEASAMEKQTEPERVEFAGRS